MQGFDPDWMDDFDYNALMPDWDNIQGDGAEMVG